MAAADVSSLLKILRDHYFFGAQKRYDVISFSAINIRGAVLFFLIALMTHYDEVHIKLALLIYKSQIRHTCTYLVIRVYNKLKSNVRLPVIVLSLRHTLEGN